MKKHALPEDRAAQASMVLLAVAFTFRQTVGNVIPNSSVNSTISFREPCEMEVSVFLNSAVVLRNDSLWDPEHKIIYPPGTYRKWDSSSSTKREMYSGCPCKLGRPCLRKCCPLGQVFEEDKGCVSSSQGDGEFSVLVSNDNGSVSYGVLASKHFYLFFGNTCYYGYYRLRPEIYEDNSYFIRASNGSLAMPVAHVDSLWTDEFCVEHDTGAGEPRPFLCLPLFKRMKAVVPSIAFPVFLLIATPIACCTFLAYVFLRESRRTMDAKLRMFLLFNVFYGFLLHACVMIYSGEVKEFQTVTLGIGSQFFTLAAGCWISVMLFCLSLSSWATSENTEEKMARNLIYFCVYSWGIPLLATLLAAVKLRGGVLPYNEVNPGYAEARAWIGIFQGALLFFFGADALLFLLNVILMVYNTIRIHQFNKEISVLGDHFVFSKHKEALWNHQKRFLACFLLLAIYCTFRSVEASFWMVALPEPGLHIVNIIDSVAEIAICIVLIINDGIFVLLRRKLLILWSSWSFSELRVKENQSHPKNVEGIKS